MDYEKLARILGTSLVEGTIEWWAIQQMVHIMVEDEKFDAKKFFECIDKERYKFEDLLKQNEQNYKEVDGRGIEERPGYYVKCKSCWDEKAGYTIEELKATLSKEGWKMNVVTKNVYCRECYQSLIAKEIKKAKVS